MRDNTEDLFTVGQKGQLCRADLHTAVLDAADVGESGHALIRHVVSILLLDNATESSGSVIEISDVLFGKMVELLQKAVRNEEAKPVEEKKEPPLSDEVEYTEIPRSLPDSYLADAHKSQRRRPLHVSVFDSDEGQMTRGGMDYFRAHDG